MEYRDYLEELLDRTVDVEGSKDQQAFNNRVQENMSSIHKMEYSPHLAYQYDISCKRVNEEK